MSPVVQTPTGPQPVQTLSGGSVTDLPVGSYPFLPWAAGAFGGFGTVSFAKLYRSQPWVAAAARRLSEQVARLPLHGFTYLDAEQEARGRVRDHPAIDLLSRPAPRKPAVLLHWEVALGLKVHGNHLVRKVRPRRGAPPTGLVSLDFRCVEPIFDGHRLIAWRWRGPDEPGLLRDSILDLDDVVHFAWSAPEAGALGVSPLEQLGVTLRSEDAIQRYGESSFRNGARIGMAAILDKSVNADKAKRDGVREELQAAHGGVDNAFRPVVLGGGIVDLKPIGGQTAAEAELIRQRTVNREEVAAVYGIPQPLAGILDHATYSNVGELLGALFTIYLAPELALTAGTWQAQLIDSEPAWSDDGVFVDWARGEVLKGDTPTRMQAYATALQNGVLTLNDVRRLENLPPYPDPRADEPLIAANNVRPLSAVGQDPSPATTVNLGPPPPAPEQIAAALAAALEQDPAPAALAAALEAAGVNGSSRALADDVTDALAVVRSHRQQESAR